MWERAKDSETYFSQNCKAIPPIKSSQEDRKKNMKNNSVLKGCFFFFFKVGKNRMLWCAKNQF